MKTMKTPPLPSGQEPVVVTGIPRSGTSWVGKLLQASGELTYINEPLNPAHPPGRSPGVLCATVGHAYQYITAANEDGWLEPFRDTLRLRYHIGAELRRNRSPYDLARRAKYATNFGAGRLRGRRPLLDDPYAMLASEWLARRLGCRVIVLVRDPAAIVSSWKRLGWTADLGALLGQPLLLRDWLEPFRREMDAVAAVPEDVAGRVGLLWRLLYLVVGEYERRCPRLWIIRYEDLASDPLSAFAGLYATLGLHFDERARRAVTRSTTGSLEGRAHRWSLSSSGLSKTGYRPIDSRANLVAWQDRLGAEEVARVRALTRSVAARWYSPEEDGQPRRSGTTAGR
jgi:hypothetical protein